MKATDGNIFVFKQRRRKQHSVFTNGNIILFGNKEQTHDSDRWQYYLVVQRRTNTIKVTWHYKVIWQQRTITGASSWQYSCIWQRRTNTLNETDDKEERANTLKVTDDNVILWHRQEPKMLSWHKCNRHHVPQGKTWRWHINKRYSQRKLGDAQWKWKQRDLCQFVEIQFPVNRTT